MNPNAIHVNHTSIIVPNYELGENEKIEKSLSVWNDVYFRSEAVGFEYNEEKKELILPRGLDLGYLEYNLQRPIEIDYNPDEAEKASYRLRTEPKDDVQRKSISFLLGVEKFSYTRNESQLALTLPTGFGKTYVVIAALTFMKTKSLIITHTDNIKEQWKKSLVDMTDIDEKYIFNIDGSNTIKKMMKLNKLPYKVYLVNHRTIQSYAKKHGWESIGELFKKIQIGVKVYDEAHIEFENILRIDFHTNTKKTFYLTANFERSDYKDNKVFSLCFKNIPKYGDKTRNEKRKHIIYVPVFFNSKPDIGERASMKGVRGWFNRNNYSDYLISKPIFFDIIKWLLDFFKEKDGKILFLVSKIDATEVVYDYIKNTLNMNSVAIYNSHVTPDDKKKALECKIISSIPKSLGTGSDIHGLRCVFMFEPYSSSITANQSSGRLREFSPTDYTFHVELIDQGFPEIIKMYKRRLPIFKKKCFKILELNYNK